MQIQGILIKSASPGKICNLYCAGQIELQNDIPKHAKLYSFNWNHKNNPVEHTNWPKFSIILDFKPLFIHKSKAWRGKLEENKINTFAKGIPNG